MDDDGVLTSLTTSIGEKGSTQIFREGFVCYCRSLNFDSQAGSTLIVEASSAPALAILDLIFASEKASRFNSCHRYTKGIGILCIQ